MLTKNLLSRPGLAVALIAGLLAAPRSGRSENPVPYVYVKKISTAGSARPKPQSPSEPVAPTTGRAAPQSTPPAPAATRPMVTSNQNVAENKTPGPWAAFGKKGKLRSAQEIPAITVAQPVKDSRKLSDLTGQTGAQRKQ